MDGLFALLDGNSLSVYFDGQVPREKTSDLHNHVLRGDLGSAGHVTKTSARISTTWSVLPDGVVLFQGIGEQMAKECDVSYAKDFLLSLTVMAQSWPKLRESVGMHVDLTAFVSFVTEMLCALDHSSNAFALAQGCHKTELHLSWQWSADKRHRKWSHLEPSRSAAAAAAVAGHGSQQTWPPQQT